MIWPSRAFSNWLRGISTFLMIPMMSVNCSRMKRTPCLSDIFRISSLSMVSPEGLIFIESTTRRSYGVLRPLANPLCAQ
jgi:hypothetical protein